MVCYNHDNILFLLFTGLTWLLVYRTEKYIKLKAEVEKQSKKRENFSSIEVCVEVMVCVGVMLR